jgi:glycosyltransferase involved in cell wall biosynthesis
VTAAPVAPRPRVLFVVPNCPVPAATGPDRVTACTISAASEVADCEISGFVEDQSDWSRWMEFGRHLPDVGVRRLFPVNHALKRFCLRCGYGARRLPVSQAAFAVPAARRWLSGAISEYDILHLCHFNLAPVCDPSGPGTIAITPPDAFSLGALRSFRHGTSQRTRLRHLWRWYTYARWEGRELPRFEVVCLVSSRDAEYLESVGVRGPVVVVPTAAVVTEGVVQPALNAPTIGIVGDYRIPEVASSARELGCAMVHRKELRGSPVVVWGQGSTEVVRGLGFPRNWEAWEWRERYWDALRQLDILAYPHRSGSGVQTKLLDALTVGVPVVCHHTTAEPLELRNDETAQVCASASAMAAAVVSLASDPQKRADMGTRGAAHARDAFHPDRVRQQIAEAYRVALSA